jgi:hypothetical protein
MKAILKFNLPEDNQEYLTAIKASDMANFIFELVYNTKKKLFESTGDLDVEEGIDMAFKKIYELLEKHNIDIDELID